MEIKKIISDLESNLRCGKDFCVECQKRFFANVKLLQSEKNLQK